MYVYKIQDKNTGKFLTKTKNGLELTTIGRIFSRKQDIYQFIKFNTLHSIQDTKKIKQLIKISRLNLEIVTYKLQPSDVFDFKKYVGKYARKYTRKFLQQKDK